MLAFALLILSVAPCKVGAIPAAAFRSPPINFTESEIDRWMSTVVEFQGLDYPDTPLGEYLDSLVKRHPEMKSLRFRINDPAFWNCDRVWASKDTVGRLAAETCTVESHLRRLLARLNEADYVIRRGHVEITTQTALRRELRIGAKEPYPVLLRFMRIQDETLEAACERIAEKLGVTINLDPKAKEAAATKVKATFRNVPLDAAVETLAEMGGLKVVRKANAFYFSVK